MKGFRQAPMGSKKEQNAELKTELANLQMAGRISQMMTQQLMQSVKSMTDDLGFALNQLQELQYKHNAAMKFLKVSEAELTVLSNEQRLVDFTEASAKADAKESLVVGSAVEADSTITITTVAKDELGNDRGIFRSRLKLAESGVPALLVALTGKAVGEKVIVSLNGLDHEVELLAIRNPVAVVESVADTATLSH